MEMFEQALKDKGIDPMEAEKLLNKMTGGQGIAGLLENMKKTAERTANTAAEMQKINVPEKRVSAKIGETSVVASLIADGRVIINFPDMDSARKYIESITTKA